MADLPDKYKIKMETAEPDMRSFESLVNEVAKKAVAHAARMLDEELMYGNVHVEIDGKRVPASIKTDKEAR